MDSTTSTDRTTQSWLGFSLSNNPHHMINNININNLTPSSSSTSVSSHQLSLFQAFHSTSAPVSASSAQEEDAATADHSIFPSVGPKLEDFLGGRSTVAPPPQQPLLGGRFSADHIHAPPVVTISTAESDTTSEILYDDSDLKTIAASFLRGFSAATEQNDTIHKQQRQLYQQPLLQTALAPKKSVDTFGQRTSTYRGVTRHRWTGRYEAHLWDNSCRREGQSRKGRQVYLGGYDKEEKAARAYDLAALKYWGPTTTTNFPVSDYKKELEEMKHMTRQEFVASLRRKSSGFSRGASIYRGVTRHHQHGRWQARIGRVAGNKDLYLGTFGTQEEAAEAYDIAAIKFRGVNAVTNFDISRYDVKSIANTNLPIGRISAKSKNSSESASDSKSIDGSRSDDLSSASSVTFAHQQLPTSSVNLNFSVPIKQDPSNYWSNILFGCQRNTASATLQNAKNNNDTLPPSSIYQSLTNNVSALQFQSPASLGIRIGIDVKPNQSGNDSSKSNELTFSPIFTQQQSGSGGSGASGYSNSSSSIPFTTPIALNSSGSSYEGNSSYGNWIAQSLHSFQSAKHNLPVFQTPIFGME